jgi:hypothetical protein
MRCTSELFGSFPTADASQLVNSAHPRRLTVPPFSPNRLSWHTCCLAIEAELPSECLLPYLFLRSSPDLVLLVLPLLVLQEEVADEARAHALALSSSPAS